MLQEEFEAMTGFAATPKEYMYIEKQYYDFDGSKLEFCKKWKDHELPKVAADRQERAEQLEKRMGELLIEIAKKNEKINKLENWKPSDCGTHMRQEEYTELRQMGSRMGIGEAIDTVAKLFGFDENKIQIIKDVETFEKNSLGMIRVANRYRRSPVYNATDWNYVRFDCAGQQWEMVNGELRGYEG